VFQFTLVSARTSPASVRIVLSVFSCGTSNSGRGTRRPGLRPEDYGTHSLRRTKASIIYRQTGNLRAVQILLGHTKIESTVRYLGVDVEDALALAEGTEV
jgi:integrase